ncbi:SAM-dependent methyltransferase [Thalassotalea euphylliae]|uniref:SAM-dependent methyltransferase n=1 Tax=Thalassotalea euphylliae TaxID=1655234 RepID=A0A3E0TSQ7_9GAMM|nr:class I SAM-dependent methyltransferase [Thalassotalea euphylliae]REL27513.1 SAM-dependent methyltransferase [Thalassotalea euphylliae]
MNYSEIFDLRGSQYHQAMTTYPNARQDEFILPMSLFDMTRISTLADIPSGGGYISNYIPDHVRLKCLESSEQFADICRSQCLDVVNFSAHSIPLENNSIDGIISIAGLHHEDNKFLLFKEMRRVLSSSGQLVIADVEENSGVAKFLDLFVGQHNETGHQGLFFNTTTNDMLHAAGFSNIKRKRLKYHWQFTSVADMLNYIRLLFGLTKVTDQQIYQGLNNFLAFNHSADGVKLDWELLCYYQN